MAPLVAETPVDAAAVETEVNATKKSRAASPAPKAKEGKEESAKVASPSAEKTSKAKGAETAKTEKAEIEKKPHRFSIRATIGIVTLLVVLVTLCFFMPSPLILPSTDYLMIGGLIVATIALAAGIAVAVKKLRFSIASKKES